MDGTPGSGSSPNQRLIATIQSNPTPNNPKFTPTPAPKKNRTPLFAGIIAALLVGLIVLGGGYANRGSENAQLATDLTEMEQFKVKAEQQYYASLSELEEMRGSNEELNALIDQQKVELKEQKDKIAGLTRDSRNLRAARAELENLRTQNGEFLAELEELRAANATLTDNNQRLTTERDLLSSDLQTSRQNNEQLNNERAVLVSERDQLTNTNAELNRKVNVASVIRTNNLVVTGQKQRNSGRWVNRDNAKNVERISVCFNSLDNAVALPSEEVFQVRIINPNGETMSNGAAGSGVLTTDAGEEVPFTTAATFEFDGAASNHCAAWQLDKGSFPEGNYTVELYNKGFLVGNSALTLK